VKVLLNIPNDQLKHHNHSKAELRDYIKACLAEMGGCQHPEHFPYFSGIRGVTLKFVKE
jgi:hypothetical protein